MLKIDKGQPWVMWPNILVGNFIDTPANKIFDYNCDFEFKLIFELTEIIEQKSTLFAKLPSYLGIDLESYGILFILSEEEEETKYINYQLDWKINKKYQLVLKRIDRQITVELDGVIIMSIEIITKIPNDINSHIVFGSGNFPENDFNLNYISVILHHLTIIKEGVKISEHLFDRFIHNKSFDSTNNCNFLYKI